MSTYPISTDPRSPAHLRVTIDRLRKQVPESVSGSIYNIMDMLVVAATATAALAAGDVVYADSGTSVDLALADSLNTSRAIGVSQAAATLGSGAKIQTTGIVTVSTWSLTPGLRYFLSDTLAGKLTATPPTTTDHVVLHVGTAVSSTSLKLLLSPLIVL